MRRSGVRIPLAPPQADIRSRMSVFCMPGCVGTVPAAVLLVAPLVFRAPEGPAAREARHPHFVRCRASKPARALRSLRRPSHRRRLVCRRVAGRVGSLFGQRRRRPWAPRPGPSGPSGALHTSGAWCDDVLLGPSSRSPAALLSLTVAAGESRETVITFAGVCSVSGETDDTIASQIHLFSAQFWRAKASWVSWRRPEAPAMVLTVSSCGAVSSMGATKFAQRRLSMAIARDYSPSTGKVAQNERFMACWASFFAEMAHMAKRWASFFAPTGTVIRPRSPHRH